MVAPTFCDWLEAPDIVTRVFDRDRSWRSKLPGVLNDVLIALCAQRAGADHQQCQCNPAPGLHHAPANGRIAVNDLRAVYQGDTWPRMHCAMTHLPALSAMTKIGDRHDLAWMWQEVMRQLNCERAEFVVPANAGTQAGRAVGWPQVRSEAIGPAEGSEP